MCPGFGYQPRWSAYTLIAVFLFTQLEHNGSIKGQYSTYSFVKIVLFQLKM